MTRILNIVPVPVSQEALSALADQVPAEVAFPGFENVFVAAKKVLGNRVITCGRGRCLR